jgi:predicted AlkP superfamily phosphohydrolase/phosphomutase
VGWDGTCLEVIEPLLAAGRLPNLAALRASGQTRRLHSTTPPMSFPAWSSFATGLSPGEHGLFDFTQKLPGEYRIRFTSAADRAGETFSSRASRAGDLVLSLGMPASYPPETVRGFVVPGFDAPVSTGSHARAASDPALYRELEARVGPWMAPGLDETARAEGFHERAIGLLLARIEQKQRFALAAFDALCAQRAGLPPDLALIVFSESDTAAHHYWRDHDSGSPRHDPKASALRRGALAAVYDRLDAALGALRAAWGADAVCAVASDHGSGGAAAQVLHLGRFLEERGFLGRRAREAGAASRDALARGLRDLALRWLPPRAAERVFRRARGAAARVESAARFGGIDWARTSAFSEDVNTQPGVWINLRGREAEGCVARDDYERVRDEVIDALLDWKLPGGARAIARARRREEVYFGERLARAPDVIIETADDAGYGLSLVPTPWRTAGIGSVHRLAGEELGGGRGRGMNGAHRPDGVWIAAGPGLRADPEVGSMRIESVAPALLSLRGFGLETGSDRAPAPPRDQPYTAAEEEVVAERLRALGYLE